MEVPVTTPAEHQPPGPMTAGQIDAALREALAAGSIIAARAGAVLDEIGALAVSLRDAPEEVLLTMAGPIDQLAGRVGWLLKETVLAGLHAEELRTAAADYANTASIMRLAGTGTGVTGAPLAPAAGDPPPELPRRRRAPGRGRHRHLAAVPGGAGRAGAVIAGAAIARRSWLAHHVTAAVAIPATAAVAVAGVYAGGQPRTLEYRTHSASAPAAARPAAHPAPPARWAAARPAADAARVQPYRPSQPHVPAPLAPVPPAAAAPGVLSVQQVSITLTPGPVPGELTGTITLAASGGPVTWSASVTPGLGLDDEDGTLAAGGVQVVTVSVPAGTVLQGAQVVIGGQAVAVRAGG
jgi:hypothetical protein